MIKNYFRNGINIETRIFSTIIILICSFSCWQPLENNLLIEKQEATLILNQSLSDTTKHNVLNFKKVIVKDSLTAISVAEPLLFGIYGKENIIRQKPYQIFHIDNYWVLSGTLHTEELGGTFLIIIDDRNCQIIRITHGK